MADKLREIVDRIKDKEWTPDRQADLAGIAKHMEEQNRSAIGLNDEQLAELQRIIDERDPESMTLDAFNAYMHKRYGV